MSNDELISISRTDGHITLGSKLIEEYGYDEHSRVRVAAEGESENLFLIFGEGDTKVREIRSNISISAQGAIREAGKRVPSETQWPDYHATEDLIRVDISELPTRVRVEA